MLVVPARGEATLIVPRLEAGMAGDAPAMRGGHVATIPFGETDDPFALVATAVRAGARAVVVSRGSVGAVLATDHSRSLIAAPAVAAVDTAGAGDVLTGTLAGLLAQGVEIAAAVDVAVAAASLSVTRSGTTPSFPSRAEIAALRVAQAAGALEHYRA